MTAPRRTIQNWEADETKIPPQYLKKLQDIEQSEKEPFFELCSRLRRTLNLSMEEMALKIGVDKKSWQSWETGEKKPNGKHRQLVIDLKMDQANKGGQSSHNIRIYKLSKELKISNEQVFLCLEHIGIKVASPSNVIDSNVAQQVRALVASNTIKFPIITKQKEQIAHRIQHILSKGYSQTDLARELQVSDRTIRNWIAGDANITKPSLKLLEQIERKFKR